MVSSENTSQSPNKALWFVLGGCLALFICLACLGLAALAGFFAYYELQLAHVGGTATAVTFPSPTTSASPTVTSTSPPAREDRTSPTPPVTPTPTATATATPQPTLVLSPPADIDQRTVAARAAADLNRLFDTSSPHHDYYETALRLGNQDIGPRTVTAASYTIGDNHTFYIDGGSVEATLVAITEHAYFWVENELLLDQAAVTTAANRFEDEHYLRVVNLFGQEWQPGIDNDPHFSVLHLTGSTSADELGYFSDIDEYPRTLYSDSNEQEIIYLNMSQLDLGSDLYYGTVVHELQHLVQWYVDSNETTWLNEGLSQLAEIYVGLNTVSTAPYLRRSEIRLNSWDYDNEVIDAHYGAAYLYSVYLWEQLGEAAVQELSRHPANGLTAVRLVLQGYGEPTRSLEQFTADWAVATFLDDATAGPQYHYQNLDLGRPTFTERIKDLPFAKVQELNQFGVHYINLDFRGPSTVTFAGDTAAELIDAPPRSGEQMWFAPAENDTNAQLTAAFDLTTVEQATLKFSAWYDLEDEWDFAYVSISSDDGQSWELLLPDHAKTGNFGPAFNGRSEDANDAVEGWVKETIPLNSYIGRSVLIRFEVLTDSAVLGRGFAIDDLAIPELGYQSDVENGSDGWEANGFVQTGWQLPQQWAVQLIHGGPEPQVVPLPLNEFNQGQWRVDIGKGGGVLVVTPLTPFIDAPATYWLNIEQ